MTPKEIIGWLCFGTGTACLIYVAAVKGGVDGAIGAVGTSLLTAAAVFGVQARSTTTTRP
jgi:hypothetical protein